MRDQALSNNVVLVEAKVRALYGERLERLARRKSL